MPRRGADPEGSSVLAWDCAVMDRCVRVIGRSRNRAGHAACLFRRAFGRCEKIGLRVEMSECYKSQVLAPDFH